MIEHIVDYLYQIPRFARTGGLEVTRERLRLLGNPEKQFHYIHVAGTNGKGSTCAYLESVLRHMGFRTGLFTSPHLVRINERMRIDNQEISDEAFEAAFHKVKTLIDQQISEGIGHPTFFEFIYLMAMCAFADAGIEYGIIETGLGGRLDLTNAIESPDLTVITSISLDHTAILGDTIEKIAAEKSGIIKPKIPVVYLERTGSGKENAAWGPAAAEVIKNKADACQSPKFPVRSDWMKKLTMDNGGIHFSYECPSWEKYDIILKTTGIYQVENASLAMTALEVLYDRLAWLMDRSVFRGHVQQGIEQMIWPGRMESVAENMYVDGAHNDDAVCQLVDSVNQAFEGRDIYLVFAVAEDKDYREMVRHISHIRGLKGVIVTEIDNGRRRDFHEVMADFEENWHGNIQGTYNVREAVKTGQQWMGQDGILICTGSLYLVGHVKEILGGI